MIRNAYLILTITLTLGGALALAATNEMRLAHKLAHANAALAKAPQCRTPANAVVLNMDYQLLTKEGIAAAKAKLPARPIHAPPPSMQLAQVR
jgi:hypothetical protein